MRTSKEPEEQQRYKENRELVNRNTIKSHELGSITLEQHVRLNKISYFMAFFIIGLINNTGWVLVGSAAQEIAGLFKKGHLMSLFQLCLVMLAMFSRIINSQFMLKILHKKRVILITILFATGFLIISMCTTANEDQSWAFYFSLVGSILIGCTGTFGEAVILGYLKEFPADLITGWSSGTGMSGIFGSGILILLDFMKFPLWITFLLMMPIAALYSITFLWVERNRLQFGKRQQQYEMEQEIENNNNNGDMYNQGGLSIQDNSAQGNIQLSRRNLKRALLPIWKLAFNLGLVYFLEYVIITGLSDRIVKHSNNIYNQNHGGNPDIYKENFLQNHGYAILQFCYQLGVFVSRSSLQYIKIRKVHWLTFLQGVNFCLFFLFALHENLTPSLEFILPIMLWVGFMGGAAYVNIMYIILHEDLLSKNEKELGVNLCGFLFIDPGILMASLISLGITNIIH